MAKLTTKLDDKETADFIEKYNNYFEAQNAYMEFISNPNYSHDPAMSFRMLIDFLNKQTEFKNFLLSLYDNVFYLE